MKTILHLSDLHFGEDDSETLLFKELDKFEEKIIECGFKINYVFMTGDMGVFNCLPVSYKYLSMFIKFIIKRFNISKNNIFYVTGNHENITKFNESTEEWNLFKNFVNKYCNKICLKESYNLTIEDFRFKFCNSLTYFVEDKVNIKKTFSRTTEKYDFIYVQHAKEKHYDNPQCQNKKVICGHKIDEHIDCESVNHSDDFDLVVGSHEGFCSGEYTVGLYTLNRKHRNISTHFIKFR